MRQNTLFLTLSLLALLLLESVPGAALALSDTDELNICLCRNVAARILCKDVEDFDYVTTQSDGTHVFTVFYADKKRQIQCYVSDSLVQIKAHLKHMEYHSVPYDLNPAEMCATVDLAVPQCPARWPIRCCAEKSPDDIQEEKSLEFWSRPVPELLKDELESGIAREQNATDQ